MLFHRDNHPTSCRLTTYTKRTMRYVEAREIYPNTQKTRNNLIAKTILALIRQHTITHAY